MKDLALDTKPGWSRLFVPALLAATLMGVVTGHLSAADEKPPDPPLHVTADVTKSGPVVLHRIENNRYRTVVRYKFRIQGNEPRTLRIESPSTGSWAAPRFNAGLSIRTQVRNPDGSMLPTDPTIPLPDPLPAPVHGTEYRFQMTIPLRLGVAEKHYKDILAKCESDAAEEIKRRGGNPETDANRDATIRKHISTFLGTYPSAVTRIGGYENFELKRLSRPRFLESKANPKNNLRNLFEWVETDILFENLAYTVDDRLSEDKILRLGREIRDVLAGVPRPADPTPPQLKPGEIDDFRKLIEVEYEAVFVPLRAKDTPDDGWIDARRISLSKDAAGAVLWSGEAGSQDSFSRFDWLAFRSAAEADKFVIQTEQPSKTLSWAIVEGQDGWRYLRAASGKRQGLEPFTIRFSLEGLEVANDRVVTVPARLPRPAKFPF